MGRVVSRICKFCFIPCNEIVNNKQINLLVKNYECQYSLDGINFKTIKSGLYIQKDAITSDYNWQVEIVDFNPTDLRYFKIVFKDSYGGHDHCNWNGFRGALLYIYNFKSIYLKESNNIFYGSLNNEINQITILDTWNKSTKEEKKNFFSIVNNVLCIDQLKSLGKFKVFCKPKN